MATTYVTMYYDLLDAYKDLQYQYCIQLLVKYHCFLHLTSYGLWNECIGQ